MKCSHELHLASVRDGGFEDRLAIVTACLGFLFLIALVSGAI
jgi:hypothetical protein